VRRRYIRALVLWMLALSTGVSTAGAWPAGVDHSIFSDEALAGYGGPRVGPAQDLAGEQEAGGGDSQARKIVGTSLLGSGIFLCSWGITSWEVEEYQCCPANNTGNVVKIVAGIILINAGLIYLLEVMD
jgi:hypothetical protein